MVEKRDPVSGMTDTKRLRNKQFGYRLVLGILDRLESLDRDILTDRVIGALASIDVILADVLKSQEFVKANLATGEELEAMNSTED